MTIWKRVAVVTVLITAVCSGLMGLSYSLRMDTSVDGERTVVLDDIPTVEEIRQTGMPPGQISTSEGLVDADAQPGKPVSKAEFTAWKSSFLARTDGIDAACGSRTRSVCDDKVCVSLHATGKSARLWNLARRPEQVAERALVHFAGFPEEIDSCSAKMRASATGEDAYLSTIFFGAHGTVCAASMPEAETDSVMAERHAAALCEWVVPTQ